MLRELMEHATQPKFVYRHTWRVGDLVIWDNLTTMHRARPFDDGKYRRELRRVTTLDIAQSTLAVETATPSRRPRSPRPRTPAHLPPLQHGAPAVQVRNPTIVQKEPCALVLLYGRKSCGPETVQLLIPLNTMQDSQLLNDQPFIAFPNSFVSEVDLS